MAALGKIIGIHIMDKIRNKNTRKAFNLTDTIVQKVNESQHKWLGHVLRLDENKIANTALHGRVEGTNKRGRPKTTWVKSTLARYEMGPQELMETAQGRNRWRSMSTNAKAYVYVHMH